MNKLRCKLVGTDGNVFSIIGKVSGTLRKAGLKDKVKEFTDKAFSAESYEAVIQLAMKYVEVE